MRYVFPKLLQHSRLNLSDLLIFLLIDVLTKKDPVNFCAAGNVELSEELGLSPITIASSVNQRLIKNGYVKKVKFDGRVRFLKTIV